MVNRNAYKSSSLEDLKKTDKKTNGNQKLEFISLEHGINLIRIYPHHPEGGGSSFIESKVTHYLPLYVDERDSNGNIIKDENGQPKKVLQNRQVFSASQHSSNPSKDIIAEYIKFAEKVANMTYSSDTEIKQFLSPIFNFKGGITPTTKYCVYADKIEEDGSKKFGRLELTKAVKIRLNQIAAVEAANEPLGMDPFTHPDDGRAIKITYNKKATKAADFYITEIDSSFDKKTKMVKLYPLSDEDLINFEKFTPLYKQFHNSYKIRDFELALQGLKNFDKNNNLGIFQYEEFINICEDIRAYYEKNEPSANNIESDSNTKEEEKVDKFDLMTKTELVDYCLDNGIRVNSKMEIDQIKSIIRNSSQNIVEDKKEEVRINNKAEAIKSNLNFLQETKQALPTNKQTNEVDDLPWDENGNDKNTKNVTQEATPANNTNKLSVKERLELLRKNRG